MLHQGRMEIANAKKTVEGAIGDAKAIANEITGFWGWIKGLFKQDEEPEQETIKPLAQTKTAKGKQSYEELELQLINDVGANLATFFDIQQQVAEHYLSLEEESKTNYQENQNTSKKAIERTLVELQMENLDVQIRETMVYAPPELKNIYSRFLVMHDKVKQEQEFARGEQQRKARMDRWQRELRRNSQVSRILSVVGVLLATAYLWGFLLALRWQTEMQTGFWSD